MLRVPDSTMIGGGTRGEFAGNLRHARVIGSDPNRQAEDIRDVYEPNRWADMSTSRMSVDPSPREEDAGEGGRRGSFYREQATQVLHARRYSIAWVGCTTKVKFRQHLGWLTRESSLSRRMKQGIYEYAHTRFDRCAKHPYNSTA